MKPIGANERTKIKGSHQRADEALDQATKVIIPSVLCRYNQTRSNFWRSKYIPVNNNAENKAPPSCAFLLSLIRSWRAWEFLLPGGTENTCPVKTPQDQYTVLTDGISSWRRSKRRKLEWIKNLSSKERNWYLTDRNGWFTSNAFTSEPM